jgi:hypothetical protein
MYPGGAKGLQPPNEAAGLMKTENPMIQASLLHYPSRD